MPIYEYECGSCGEKFEQFRAISGSSEEVECPRCGSKDVHRVISAFFSRLFSGGSCGPTFPT